MSKIKSIQEDIREAPAYSIGEAADYLRLPKSTLRAWVLGQRYGKEKRLLFKAVIAIADREDRRLSFINLVEAFVLAGIRREHNVPLPTVRKAVEYLRRTFKTQRPLAEEQFETDGVDLFVDKFGALVGASQEGQLQMREIIRERLKRVIRDPSGVAQKIVLFPMRDRNGKGIVVLDPRFSFGRPVLDGYALRTAIVSERFQAGEKIEDLARDYGVSPDAVENAIRCERRAA
jgi:uncharacterized protein (DUF433 family)